MQRHRNAKVGDRSLVNLIAVLMLFIPLSGALQYRIEGDSELSWTLRGAGILFIVGAYALSYAAMAVHPYFERNVRIRSDRLHTVIRSGRSRRRRDPLCCSHGARRPSLEDGFDHEAEKRWGAAMESDPVYELELTVRDYELDMQGVVNNANYQHYLEHARHEFMRAAGVEFAALQQRGMIPMVSRIEIDYKQPLKSGDRFVVRLGLRRHGRLRFLFDQDIYRVPDGVLVASAVVTGVVIHEGRPVAPDEVVGTLERYAAHRREQQ
jgi:acyl-CoA thioester hydrolase